MKILPAIDLYEGKAVRLFRGDYDQMTVYDENPVNTALKFKEAGAHWIHVVDLEGARDGGTPNMGVIKEIIDATGLKVEIGGGIRNMETIEKYIDMGASRVILGTSAITNENLVVEATRLHGNRIAVGADVKGGYVAIRGWTQKSMYTLHDFCENMQMKGVKYIICTDISKDGALEGTNRAMYEKLTAKYKMRFIASGGISSIDDIRALKDIGLYGAIIGKAYYQGVIDLKSAIQEAE
ncbi:MAG: 1-(5-phosphoribosyl)-5-[(5-phosphoribosylamino)methylideneamino]imidazole-4-carboxamide isomerase [Clostridia bacterium]|nr:1-(5-phosphoribosyl)-5-[(5-phosphoribosylamino)methylideneamino]imidazole-4-carboxamide isomerase [Clostridia bacterium]